MIYLTALHTCMHAVHKYGKESTGNSDMYVWRNDIGRRTEGDSQEHQERLFGTRSVDEAANEDVNLMRA